MHQKLLYNHSQTLGKKGLVRKYFLAFMFGHYNVVAKVRVGGLLIEPSFSVIINLFASMQIKAHFDYNVTVAMQK